MVFARGNIICALKNIKHGGLKVLFVRLNNLFAPLIKLFGPIEFTHGMTLYLL
jgi:hypothetical protein